MSKEPMMSPDNRTEVHKINSSSKNRLEESRTKVEAVSHKEKRDEKTCSTEEKDELKRIYVNLDS
jgi:hypothetical protein